MIEKNLDVDFLYQRPPRRTNALLPPGVELDNYPLLSTMAFLVLQMVPQEIQN